MFIEWTSIYSNHLQSDNFSKNIGILKGDFKLILVKSFSIALINLEGFSETQQWSWRIRHRLKVRTSQYKFMSLSRAFILFDGNSQYTSPSIPIFYLQQSKLSF